MTSGKIVHPISSVQSLSHVRLFAIPWTAAHQASLSFTNSQSVLKLMCIKSVMPSNHLIFCCPLLLLPSIFPSSRVFSNESVLWPPSGGQSIGASASASVLPMNIQDWFPLGFTGLISLHYIVFIASLAIGPRVATVWLLPLSFYWKYSKVRGDNKPLLQQHLLLLVDLLDVKHWAQCFVYIEGRNLENHKAMQDLQMFLA